jgi:carbamoyltransferase
MIILGISCFYHDAAACLLRDGVVVAAAEEERFTRKKHDFGFPQEAVAYCLREAGITIDQVDLVGFYEKPFVRFERLLFSFLATFPRSYSTYMASMPAWLKEKLWTRSIIRKRTGYRGQVLFADHHQSHAASAFLPSPFERAAILTVDGVGEWTTTAYGVGEGNQITLLKEIRFPHSLGLLYSALTVYLGFRANNDEYKVMGLASYGDPVYYDDLCKIVQIQTDGSYALDMTWFAYHYGLHMLDAKFHKRFGPPRVPESSIERRHVDMAASVQKLLEDALLAAARHLHDRTKLDTLCMAGGVALNCVANGRLLKETPFRQLFIQPAAGDDGGAMGVALYIYHSLLGNPRQSALDNVYLGPAYSTSDIRQVLDSRGVRYRDLERQHLLQETARLIAGQKIIGWFQGRMEWGPRALGNRSILADPRNATMKDILNDRVKHREDFRPFAPAILEERMSEYMDLDCSSPFMLLIAGVRKEQHGTIPAVTHVDGTARPQSVNRDQNPLFYDLIKEFHQQTGVPVLINTSFNVRGEPIVCSPTDALNCFLSTGIDVLVMDQFVVEK